MLIDDRLTAILPTLNEIFNIVPGDADGAHTEGMNRAQLAGSDQLPNGALRYGQHRSGIPDSEKDRLALRPFRCLLHRSISSLVASFCCHAGASAQSRISKMCAAVRDSEIVSCVRPSVVTCDDVWSDA